jgi:hypothetical protein
MITATAKPDAISLADLSDLDPEALEEDALHAPNSPTAERTAVLSGGRTSDSWLAQSVTSSEATAPSTEDVLTRPRRTRHLAPSSLSTADGAPTLPSGTEPAEPAMAARNSGSTTCAPAIEAHPGTGRRWMSASLKHHMNKAGWVGSMGLSREMFACRDLLSGHEVHATQHILVFLGPGTACCHLIPSLKSILFNNLIHFYFLHMPYDFSFLERIHKSSLLMLQMFHLTTILIFLLYIN